MENLLLRRGPPAPARLLSGRGLARCTEIHNCLLYCSANQKKLRQHLATQSTIVQDIMIPYVYNILPALFDNPACGPALIEWQNLKATLQTFVVVTFNINVFRPHLRDSDMIPKICEVPRILTHISMLELLVKTAINVDYPKGPFCDKLTETLQAAFDQLPAESQARLQRRMTCEQSMRLPFSRSSVKAVELLSFAFGAPEASPEAAAANHSTKQRKWRNAKNKARRRKKLFSMQASSKNGEEPEADDEQGEESEDDMPPLIPGDGWEASLGTADEAGVPQKAVCQLSGALMHDPVSTPDGYLFERAALEDWTSQHGSNPLTGAPLAMDEVVDREDIANFIQGYQLQMLSVTQVAPEAIDGAGPEVRAAPDPDVPAPPPTKPVETGPSLLGDLPALSKTDTTESKRKDKAKIRIESRSVVDCPEDMRCAIDGKVMVNPVLSRYGHHFERKTLEKWFGNCGSVCPITQKPLRLEECQPDQEMKKRFNGPVQVHDQCSDFSRSELSNLTPNVKLSFLELPQVFGGFLGFNMVKTPTIDPTVTPSGASDAGMVPPRLSRRQRRAEEEQRNQQDRAAESPVSETDALRDLRKLVKKKGASSENSWSSAQGPETGVRWRGGTPPVPPKWNYAKDDLRAFTKFERKVALWQLQVRSYMSPAEAALALYTSLGGEAEEELEHIDLKRLYSKTGIEFLLEQLRGPLQAKQIYPKRKYLSDYEALLSIGIDVGLTYDAESRGSRLLDRAKLSHEQQRMVLVGTGQSLNFEAGSDRAKSGPKGESKGSKGKGSGFHPSARFSSAGPSLRRAYVAENEDGEGEDDDEYHDALQAIHEDEGEDQDDERDDQPADDDDELVPDNSNGPSEAIGELRPAILQQPGAVFQAEFACVANVTELQGYCVVDTACQRPSSSEPARHRGLSLFKKLNVVLDLAQQKAYLARILTHMRKLVARAVVLAYRVGRLGDPGKWMELLEAAEKRLGKSKYFYLTDASKEMSMLKQLVPWEITKAQVYGKPMTRRVPVDVPFTHRGAALITNGGKLQLESEDISEIRQPRLKFDVPVRIAIFFYGMAENDKEMKPARDDPKAHVPGLRTDVSFPGVPDSIPKEVRAAVARLHCNAGHPSKQETIRLLAAHGSINSAVLTALDHLKCGTCERARTPLKPRPASVPEFVGQFAEQLQADVFYVRDLSANNHPVLGVTCLAAKFYQAALLSSRDPQVVLNEFDRLWLRPFGYPLFMSVDADGAFEGAFQQHLQESGTVFTVVPADGHHQIGATERKNAVFRSVLEKLIDQNAVCNKEQLDLCLSSAIWSVNSSIHTRGRSSMQAVFGKLPRFPGNLFSDSAALATSDYHMLPEHLRTQACQAVNEMSASSIIRRALLRKTATSRARVDELLPGSLVAYWRWNLKARAAATSSAGSLVQVTHEQLRTGSGMMVVKADFLQRNLLNQLCMNRKLLEMITLMPATFVTMVPKNNVINYQFFPETLQVKHSHFLYNNKPHRLYLPVPWLKSKNHWSNRRRTSTCSHQGTNSRTFGSTATDLKPDLVVQDQGQEDRRRASLRQGQLADRGGGALQTSAPGTPKEPEPSRLPPVPSPLSQTPVPSDFPFSPKVPFSADVLASAEYGSAEYGEAPLEDEPADNAANTAQAASTEPSGLKAATLPSSSRMADDGPPPQLPAKRPHDALQAQQKKKATAAHSVLLSHFVLDDFYEIYRLEEGWDGSPDYRLHSPCTAFRCCAAKVEDTEVSSDSSDSSDDGGASHSPGLSRQERKAIDREIPWRTLMKEYPSDIISLYVKANRKEYDSWMSWNSIKALSKEEARRVLSDPILRKRVMPSRNAYRDKNRGAGPEVRAKCRTIVQGCHDPDLGLLDRSSPAPTRNAELLLYEIACAGYNRRFLKNKKAWKLWSGDVATAFLQGQPEERDLPIYMRPPRDGIQGLAGTFPFDLYQIVGNLYGLCNAPRTWINHIVRKLQAAKFLRHRLDHTVYYKLDSQGELLVVLLFHVDDFLTAFREDYEFSELQNMFTWGQTNLLDDGDLVFKGKEVSLKKVNGEYEIHVTQKAFISELVAGKLKRGRASETTPLTPEEMKEYRSCAGSLQWLAGSTRPDIAATVSLSNHGVNSNPSQLKVLYECIDYVKETPDQGLVFQGVAISYATVVVGYAESSWANALGGKSQMGVIIVITGPECQDQVSRATILDWRSSRSPRVTRSTLASEANAMDDGVDRATFLNVFLSEFLKRPNNSGQLEKGVLKQLQVTDCKSLFDAVICENPSLEEKRTLTSIRSIQD
ncbi:GIP [Symbiodinium necroappetens]|uniref:GIP protein n=1 Tax=Symbiodinium necroappetens TaxID=1628268 RepID=A0A812JNF5_9DINO|nr:GIP [Symbiodinium necroappetens]